MPILTRRASLTALAGAAALAWAPRAALAQAAAGPFVLDPLPYPLAALEPHIDARTMELHHGRHHAAYVANLNAAAKEAPAIAQRPIEAVLADLASVPEAQRQLVRNNLGGHANHTMYWQVMGPNGGDPSGEVLAAIDRDFGGTEAMRTAFNAGAARVFGSGWMFVTVTREGRLALEPRPNQDSPLMDGKRALLGNDVWEHAYYLSYQNRRADYLASWWKTVNWAAVGDRYARAKLGTLTV